MGSCAKSRDTLGSSIDVFIVSDQQDKVLQIIGKHQLGDGFEGIEIQHVVLVENYLTFALGCDLKSNGTSSR